MKSDGAPDGGPVSKMFPRSEATRDGTETTAQGAPGRKSAEAQAPEADMTGSTKRSP